MSTPLRRSTRKKEPKQASLISDDHDDDDDDDEFDGRNDEAIFEEVERVEKVLSTTRRRGQPQRQRKKVIPKASSKAGNPPSASITTVPSANTNNSAITEYLEITLDDDTESKVIQPTKTSPEPTGKAKVERALRTTARHVHLLCLLLAYSIKSRVLRTPGLKALVLSRVPPHLLRQFSPEIIADGRTFLNALSMLSNWWKNGINRQSSIDCKDLDLSLVRWIPEKSHFRWLRSVINDRAGQDEDLVATFVILLLALGLDARFICSLQPNLVKPDPDFDSPSLPNSPIAATSRTKRKSTKTTVTENVISVTSITKSSSGGSPARPNPPPQFWCEVWHPRETRWIPVDCLRANVNDRLAMEPPSKSKHQHLFIIAYDAMGRAVDVTRRYCSRYYAHTLKLRRPDEVIITPYLNQHYLGTVMSKEEEEQLAALVDGEPLPTTTAGFHCHGKYMLESKLKKYEVYWPSDAGIIGEFRGENVRLRSVVQKVRSKEAWYTQFGRIIKEGEEPCKQVKLPKKPERKRRKYDDGLPDLPETETNQEIKWQPLYGEWQTEPYSPPIASDGKVPRNRFGNVDLYLPSMMPVGCVWIDDDHAYIAARDLGVDYAAACVRFAFSGRFAVPNLRGIIICAEFEGPVRKRLQQVKHELIQVAIEAEIEAEEKKARLEKRKKKILNKLVEDHNLHNIINSRSEEGPGSHHVISALDPKSKHQLDHSQDNLDDLF